jgi:hypothetical protein
MKHKWKGSGRQSLVTANSVPSSPILITLMMEELCSSKTSVITTTTRRNIPEDGILHSHRRKNLKSYIALTSWTVAGTWCVSCEVRTGFYIPEDDILHSHRRENIKSYIALAGWTLKQGRDVSPVRYELGFYIPEDCKLWPNVMSSISGRRNLHLNT